ncbi:uncharacterized protein BXIN_0971 [Babesia sp. Xinjiang]|uniref:uncharacterized protein n=1 Tax=Babesia sp. Xinjiang TaxID=462227 RepID=UPI000A25A10D|nr:uncharacterized protein BXIN_0971 [Babesia sp. Xinjiang]ORM42194.1 hypothetical protein BXIN_0971 [Babesia sp. Xinjiang]
MRGKGNSGGRGNSRGRGSHQAGRRFQSQPAAYPNFAAANHMMQPPFAKTQALQPPTRYKNSPVQMRQDTPAGLVPPFRLSPRIAPRRPPAGFPKHSTVPIHPMYKSDVMMQMSGSLTHHVTFPKAMPFGGNMQTKGRNMKMTTYDHTVPKEHTNMQNFHELMKRGMVPQMMMGQFMPMFQMGGLPGAQDTTSGAPRRPGSANMSKTWKRSMSPNQRRAMKSDNAEETQMPKPEKLDTLVDANKVHAKVEVMVQKLERIQDAMNRIKIAIPSIFRVRNNFKLRPEEERMIASVEEVFRYILIVHLATAHQLCPPFDFQKNTENVVKGKEPLLKYVGGKTNMAVLDVMELQNVINNQPLYYNAEWFTVTWDDNPDSGTFAESNNNRTYYVRAFDKNTSTTDGNRYAVFLRSISVHMFEEHMDTVKLLCNMGTASKEGILRVMGYYALCCEDDPFITLATSILPAMDIDIQIQFYRQIAQLLDTSKYTVGGAYMERYFERVLPMCLAVPDAAAWAPIITMLMKSLDSLRLGVKNSNTAVTLLRTLKSWCKVFVKCEETCIEVFNKCIQLVLHAGDDSRIVVRGAATDLAVQIWLNSNGREAVLKRIGYETIRALGCISGVQAIKFNIWSDLLSPETTEPEPSATNTPQLERILSRVGQDDALVQALQHEEADFISSMLTAEPQIVGHLMNWYLLRYCKITKTVLALEKIATVIRFALVGYPKMAKDAPPHTSNNLGTFCCWMLNIATSCSVGSGCLELANVKMALFVDWLFFNYQYNARIIRLCLGPSATAQYDYILQNMQQCRRLFVKELAKCVYTLRRQDMEDDSKHVSKINVLLGTSAVLNFAYNNAVDTYRRLLDYLLNAILHYHSEVGVIAVDVMSAIFVVSVLEMTRMQYTLLTFQRTLKNTMLGRMCSVLDFTLENTAVYIAHVDDVEERHVLQPSTALEPLQEKYTMVVAIVEKRRNVCSDESLKTLLIQCYGMILEYFINLDCLNALYHGNHLTVDTLRANHEVELLELMQCPSLYTNVTIINTDGNMGDLSQSNEAIGHVGDASETVSEISDMVHSDSLSDISSEDEAREESAGDVSPKTDAEVVEVEEEQGVVETHDTTDISETDAVTDQDDRPNIPNDTLRQLVQDFVHGSMDNPAMNYADDPLYKYMKESIEAEGPPDYKLVVDLNGDSFAALKFENPNFVLESSSSPYRVANVINIIVSYLHETALQFLQDDATGGTSVDSILFKEWVVHIFNVFVRLFVSLYLVGNVAIVWELMYYVAAVPNVTRQSTESSEAEGTDINTEAIENSDVTGPLRKKVLIATTLLSNTIDAVTHIRPVNQDAVIQRTLAHVLKRAIGRTGTTMGVIVDQLTPIRVTLDAIFKSDLDRLGKLPSIVGVMVKLTPVTAINELVSLDTETQFNVFKEHWLKQRESYTYVRSLLSGGGDDPLRIRQHFILWQMICRMYELAFGTHKMRHALKQKRNFLKMISRQAAPTNIARLPYVTEGDICNSPTDKKGVICFLGASYSKRSNFMTFQKGYTFTNDLFSNEHMKTISSAIMEVFKTGEIPIMQIALFSAFPILVHSVPTQSVVSDIAKSAAIVSPKNRDVYSLPMQFIWEMLIAVLAHWLVRYPQLFAPFENDLDHLHEALDQLAVKYAAGRVMQFAFNGTAVKIRLEQLFFLKMSV